MVANEKDEVVVPEEALAAAASQEALTEEDQQLLDKYSRTFIGSFSHSLDAKGLGDLFGRFARAIVSDRRL